jgi:hypothetical protein
LLTEYGVTEHDHGALTALAQTTRLDGWCRQYGNVIDEQFRELLALESAASGAVSDPVSARPCRC